MTIQSDYLQQIQRASINGYLDKYLVFRSNEEDRLVDEVGRNDEWKTWAANRACFREFENKDAIYLVPEPTARPQSVVLQADWQMPLPLSGDNGANTIPKSKDDGELTKRAAYLADSKHNPQNPDRWAEGQGGPSGQEREPGPGSRNPDGEALRRTRDRTPGDEDQTNWGGGGGNRNEFRHKNNRKGSNGSHQSNRGGRGGNSHSRKSLDDGKRDSEGGQRNSVQFAPLDADTSVENTLETQDADDEEGSGWISNPDSRNNRG